MGKGKKQQVKIRLKTFINKSVEWGAAPGAMEILKKTIIQDGQECSQETTVYSQLDVFCSRCFVHDNKL